MAHELTVMLLVDNSASMAGAPLEAVNRGLIHCARLLLDSPSSTTTRLGLIRFATDAEVLQSPVEPIHFRPPRLMAGGTTALSRGLVALGHCLRGLSHPSVVFLLTDGRPDVGDPWREVLSSLYSEGHRASFVALGLGPDIDEAVLTQLAGARVYRLTRPDPTGIGEAFSWIGHTITTWQNSPAAAALQEPAGWSRARPHAYNPGVVDGELMDSLSTFKPRRVDAIDVEEVGDDPSPPSPPIPRPEASAPPAAVLGNLPEDRPISLGLTDKYVLTVVTTRRAWSQKVSDARPRWQVNLPSRLAAIHPAGDLFATTLGGKVRMVFRGQSGPNLAMERCSSLAYSSQGEWLAMAGKPALHIVDVENGKTVLRHDEGLRPSVVVHLCGDGIHLALVDDQGLLRMWNLETGHVVWYMELSVPLHVTGGREGVMLISTLRESLSVEVDTGRVVWWQTLQSMTPPVLRPLAQGQLVARSRGPAGVEVLSAEDGQTCATLPPHDGADLVTNHAGQLLFVSPRELHLGELRRRGHLWSWSSLMRGTLSTLAALSAMFFLLFTQAGWTPTATAPIQQLPQTAAPGGLLFTQGSTLPLPLQSWISLSYAHADSPWLWFVSEGDEPGSWVPLITDLDHLSVSLTAGLSPRFGLGLTVPAQWTSIDTDVAQEIGTSLEEGGPQPGDPSLELRWVPLHLRRIDVNTGLVGSLSLPVGDQDYQAGAGTFTSTLTWLVDQQRDRHQIALNVGWTHTYADLVSVGGAVWGDELHVGVGARWDLVPDRVGFLGDVSASSIVLPWGYVGSPLQSPLEVAAGIRLSPDGRWTWNAGGGAGITLGYGTPSWRLFTGVTCRLGSTQHIHPTLPFATRMKLRYVEHPRVEVVASPDLNGGRPLRLLVVDVDGSTFRRMRYDDMSNGVYPKGVRVLHDLEVRPGTSLQLPLESQPLQQLALIGMFTDETPRWKVLLGGSPLPFSVSVHLDYDGMTVGE